MFKLWFATPLWARVLLALFLGSIQIGLEILFIGFNIH